MARASIVDYNIMGHTYMSEGEYHWVLVDSTDSLKEAKSLLKEIEADNDIGQYIDFRIEKVVTTVLGQDIDLWDENGMLKREFNTSDLSDDNYCLRIEGETGNLYVFDKRDNSVVHVWEGFFWNWLWIQNDGDVFHKMQHFSYLAGYTHAMLDMLYEVEDLDEEQKLDIQDLIKEKSLTYGSSF